VGPCRAAAGNGGDYFILNPENMLLFRDPIGVRMIILALVLR
jgi:hypothetical protein